MPATRRNVNVRSVTFVTAGGSPVTTTITGVTSISSDPQGNLLKFSGDGDHSPTTVVNDFVDPMVTITSADRTALNSLPPGTRGTLSWISKDARNPLTTLAAGDMTYSLTNAIVQNNAGQDQHRQFSTGTLIVCSESPDGITSQLTVTVT